MLVELAIDFVVGEGHHKFEFVITRLIDGVLCDGDVPTVLFEFDSLAILDEGEGEAQCGDVVVCVLEVYEVFVELGIEISQILQTIDPTNH